MNAFVVSDNKAISDKVRKVLIQGVHDCPESNVVSLASGPSIVNEAELTILVLSPDFERALLALKGMTAALAGIGRRTSGQRILAVGPADARLILRTVREGADHYFDENEVETELDAELVRMAAEGPAGPAGQVISILAPPGELTGSIAEWLSLA